jgi:solute carrier family 13 (sodium-dependent dicarboxylate transporter), member 2/3/5
MAFTLSKPLKLFLCAAAGVVMYGVNPLALTAQSNLVLSVGCLMILCWITEAMPMPVVALLPLILFPLLGLAKMEDVASSYANPVIYLFLGGFLIGLAIEKWMLHKRIALNIVKLTGTKGDRIVLGFIMASGFLSMWLSNTATTMMMYPIAMSVIQVMEQGNEQKANTNLSICLLLAIAYASNLGGMATIIGTPPNVAYVSFLEKNNGYRFNFADWMKLCMPLSILLLFVLYFVMTKWLLPVRMPHSDTVNNTIRAEMKGLGEMTKPEKRVLAVFAATALLWIMRDIVNNIQSYIRLDDTLIAVAGGVALFAIPSGKEDGKSLLVWEDTSRLSWGILLLFGGGIALADQLGKAGLITSLGNWIAGFAAPGFMLVLVITLVSIFVSEVMSNVAQVIVFAPVVTGIAVALHIEPLPIGMAMTLGASCAGMLPMGTPPNAIVFASGRLKLRHMVLTGFIMNIISAVLISLFCWYLLPVFVKAI